MHIQVSGWKVPCPLRREMISVRLGITRKVTSVRLGITREVKVKIQVETDFSFTYSVNNIKKMHAWILLACCLLISYTLKVHYALTATISPIVFVIVGMGTPFPIVKDISARGAVMVRLAPIDEWEHAGLLWGCAHCHHRNCRGKQKTRWVTLKKGKQKHSNAQNTEILQTYTQKL